MEPGVERMHDDYNLGEKKHKINLGRELTAAKTPQEESKGFGSGASRHLIWALNSNVTIVPEDNSRSDQKKDRGIFKSRMPNPNL